MTSSQPVRHLVFVRFPAHATSQQIEVFVDHFRAITRTIPGILAFEHGANISLEGLSRGLDHAFLLTFENAQARDNYLPHPDHQRFGQENGDMFAEVVVFDYIPLD